MFCGLNGLHVEYITHFDQEKENMILRNMIFRLLVEATSYVTVQLH